MNDPMPPHRVTHADIARRLGVSQATISLALRNDPQISQARREEVVRVAAEIGYRPDPMLSALNRYRRDRANAVCETQAVIAWVNRWRQPEDIRRLQEFDAYWHSAASAAKARGFHLEEIVWASDMSAERLLGILEARGIRGILIPPGERTLAFASDAIWMDFAWGGISAVRLGRSIHAPGFPVVTADHVHNCRLAVREIRRRGYERVGFVTSRHMAAFTLSMAGFLMAQSELPLREAHLILDDDDTAAFVRWLKAEKPDAILTDAPSAMVNEIRDICGDSTGLAVMSVRDGGADAGIDQNSEEIGRTAVEALISQLERNQAGIPEMGREILIQGCWRDGKSLPYRTSRRPAL